MRGVPRGLAVSAVVAIGAVVCAFTLHRPNPPAALIAQLAQATLPADGFASSELQIHTADGRAIRGLQVESDNPQRVTVESVQVAAPPSSSPSSSAMVTLRAGVNPGETTLRITVLGFSPRQISLQVTPDATDRIGDGTPDFLRLHDAADRAAFRRWFTLLAEAQYYRGPALPPEIDDCAALLRFAYREALRRHDSEWAHAMALPAATAGDIRQYQYPFTPLGASLFRVRDGGFVPGDLNNGAFAQFADVETLWRHNTFRVARDLKQARPGDLLFFRQQSQRMPFHAMIFVGPSQIDPGTEQFVAYHTGPTGKAPGEMRRLTVAQLLTYPDARWRPIPENPSFLGVYRWDILRGAE